MICAHCRTEFTPSRARLYCTKACARAVDRLRKQRAKPPEPDDDGRARPPVLVLSEHSLSTHGESIVSSLPATHSPLWLLPAGLSDDELMAGYGGGVW